MAWVMRGLLVLLALAGALHAAPASAAQPIAKYQLADMARDVVSVLRKWRAQPQPPAESVKRARKIKHRAR